MKAVKLFPVLLLVIFGLFANSNVAVAAPATAGFTCTGGNIPAGNYRSVLVTGVCYMPAGKVVIRGDLTIAAGALLDATNPGDPAASPLLPATVLVGGNVAVGRGSVLFLGCSPNISCPKAFTHDRIGGDVTATGALGVVIHSTWIGGSLSLLGGGGGLVGGAQSGTCLGSFTTNPPTPAPVPALWRADPALANGEGPGMPIPVYSDSEDNWIGGNLTVTNLKSCWIGSLRNLVQGSATYRNNAMGDPDAMEIDNNLIAENMTCYGNVPAVQFGDSGSAPNIVGDRASGECGFNVLDSNPSAEPGNGPSIADHITVRAENLNTSAGLHTNTAQVAQLMLGTAAGNQLIVSQYNVTITGSGLQGSVTVKPGAPLGQTGEVVGSTVFPDGSSAFTAVDNCACSYHGVTGPVTIRAYGTTSAAGLTKGVFLIVSGGYQTGGLGRLVGYGTFSSAGQPAGTVRLVEHLELSAAH